MGAMGLMCFGSGPEKSQPQAANGKSLTILLPFIPKKILEKLAAILLADTGGNQTAVV